MKTRIFFKVIGIVFAGTVFTACNGNEVERDMDEWCACEHQAKNDPARHETCVELMLEISKKYEFDPEAVETIQEKALECK